MTENDISTIVLRSAINIHRTYGPGLLESVYEEILCHEMKKFGLNCRRQVLIPLVHEGITMEISFRADIIVNDLVIIELKSVECLVAVHFKQVLTYLKISGLKLGLLINFNEALLKDGYHRIANNL
ncbi:MAG: GxxExxY protein [Bacteroidota bacterium]